MSGALIPPPKLEPYEFWKRRLNGEPITPELPVTLEPQAGFYRMRGLGASWVPVAIWNDAEGNLICVTDGVNAVGEIEAEQVWLRCAEHAITKAAHDHALDHGEWGDVDPGVMAEGPVLINENRAKAFAGQVALALRGLDAYSTVQDDGTAARAQSLRAKLLELARDADALRSCEKRPHFEAGKAIDALWQPIIKDAKAGANTIARALSAFETAKAKAAAEARVNEPLPTHIKGGYGTAAPIKEVRVISRVLDWPELFLHYVNDGAAQEYIRLRAERDLSLGLTPPGLEVDTVRRVGAK